ncbi:Carbonyl reductase family member 4 [Escovopsis weberi]|uniref:Carbonyl reductase family member 4 n=1 Tax=Escovopsis weberi TaxID=150374 RepID=A0A0M8N3V4_ESCWE|nr:Carbonyl reductase family member 4 [Escovopsis weberi]
MFRLAGKHCAIVGATGGIGFAIAKAFANHGAVVSILGRSALEAQPRLQPQLPPVPAAAPAPLVPEGGTSARSAHVPPAHRFLRLDVADAEDIKTTFSSRDELRGVGPVDVLVNCAAVSQTTLLKRTPDEQLANILDTNLLAAMLICKHAKVQANGTSPYLKPELQQAYLRDTPLHRVAEPAEVADAAVFLASNDFANNCVLNLDGGLSAA